MADDFVRVRLVTVTGVDLRLFEFDYDQTWAAFFMNADEKIYGRYGTREAAGSGTRTSLGGLRFAMEAALEAHAAEEPAGAGPPPRPGRPVLAEDYPAAKRMRGGQCIHCHQVHEFRIAYEKELGQWTRDDLWMYPLPENVGLTLDVDRGNHIRKVQTGSPADKTGIRAGDVLLSVNGTPVHSTADVQFGLHHAPAAGRVPVVWQAGGKERAAELELTAGWRKTNLTWRPSLLDLLPSLTLYGPDLSPAEKKALGLAADRLAFRQEKPLYRQAREANLREGDVIIGLDGLELAMGVDDFLGYVRRNYLIGDRVTLNVLRDGRRVDLPLTLR